jgi:uncharacterized sulfatase
MNRRDCLRTLASSLAAALALPAAEEAAEKRPNILFAIADDVSWPHFGAYGCTYVNTPHFDRVAKEGVLFTHCFTSNPKCSPSRATLLTGRNTWELEEACCHFGIFSAKFPVYPNLLADAGYHVGSTGKPWSPGNWRAGGFKENPAGKPYNKIHAKPPAKGISNKDYAANFAAFLKERPPGAPFCFWYGGHEAHRAYEKGVGRKHGKKLADATVPPYFPDDEVVRSDLLDYAYEIEWFDTHLGRMLKHLEDQGELDNTLVVVTADNGMPFPRVKGQIYDDDFHLPLAIRWPGRIPGGRTVDDLVSFTDFAPTFLEAAGLKPLAAMTGRSFLDVLVSGKSGRVDPTRDHVLVGKERHDLGRPHDVGYPVRAIRTERYLYARNFKPERWPAGDPETGYRNIDASPTKSHILDLKEQGQDRYWQLAMGKRPLEELYDLREDPRCLTNLADKPGLAAIKKRLWEQLAKELREQKDPRILGHGEVFDTYPYVGKRGHSWDSVMKAKQAKP